MTLKRSESVPIPSQYRTFSDQSSAQPVAVSSTDSLDDAHFVESSQDYVISSYFSVDECPSSPPPTNRPATSHGMPSILAPDFNAITANFRTIPLPSGTPNFGDQTRRWKAVVEQTPQGQGTLPDVDVAATTPVLFETPSNTGKRKALCDSSESPPAKRSISATMCFDLDTKINFEDAFTPEKEKGWAFSPAKPVPASVRDDAAGLFNIIHVTDSVTAFSAFLCEWKRQKVFSLSVACDRMGTEATVTIGPPRLVAFGPKKVRNSIDRSID